MPMNLKARSFVSIMIFVAFTALLLRIFIHKVIIYNIEQNQSLAQSNLKLFSTALENYALAKQGAYPTNIKQLTESKPVYLQRDYLAVSSIKGYEYDCKRLDASGYNCSAAPVNCRLTGKSVYTVSTGGLIITESCDQE
jgi:hypothetical protein